MDPHEIEELLADFNTEYGPLIECLRTKLAEVGQEVDYFMQAQEANGGQLSPDMQDAYAEALTLFNETAAELTNYTGDIHRPGLDPTLFFEYEPTEDGDLDDDI